MKKPETRLQARIRLALIAEIGGWWVKIHGSPFQHGGLPDLLGCVNGLFFGLEVKMPGEKLEPLQELCLEEIRTKGRGYATRVTSVEEALKFVRSKIG
jgi:hypothetical protein